MIFNFFLIPATGDCYTPQTDYRYLSIEINFIAALLDLQDYYKYDQLGALWLIFNLK